MDSMDTVIKTRPYDIEWYASSDINKNTYLYIFGTCLVSLHIEGSIDVTYVFSNIISPSNHFCLGDNLLLAESYWIRVSESRFQLISFEQHRHNTYTYVSVVLGFPDGIQQLDRSIRQTLEYELLRVTYQHRRRGNYRLKYLDEQLKVSPADEQFRF